MHIILRFFGKIQIEMESLLDVCSQVLFFEQEELFQRLWKKHMLLKQAGNFLHSMSNVLMVLNEGLTFGFLFQMIKRCLLCSY